MVFELQHFKEFDLLMTFRVRLPPGYKWQHAKTTFGQSFGTKGRYSVRYIFNFKKKFFSLHPNVRHLCKNPRYATAYNLHCHKAKLSVIFLVHLLRLMWFNLCIYFLKNSINLPKRYGAHMKQ